MSPKNGTPKSAKSTSSAGKKAKGFTSEERAAMKERAQELKESKADGESAVLAKIAEMPEPDRASDQMARSRRQERRDRFHRVTDREKRGTPDDVDDQERKDGL